MSTRTGTAAMSGTGTLGGGVRVTASLDGTAASYAQARWSCGPAHT